MVQASTWRRVAGALLIGAAFLLVRGYAGIRHDGILYAGDALATLKPGQFHDDLYFLFGSQGRFTVLPTLYGWLMKAFGLGGGALVGLAISGGLFLFASAFLVRTLFAPPLRFYCMASVVLGWTIYGGRRVFAYSEPFLTARSFAEPAILLGLALLIHKKHVGAAAAFGLAALLHPLLFAGGASVAWIYLAARDRRWLWLGVIGGIALGLLGAIHVGPFADLFDRYDDRWWDLVQEINVHAFVLNWSREDFGIVFFDVVVIAFVLDSETSSPLQRLLRASLVIGLGSTALSFVLVDIGRNVFFGKLQIWRGLWVMQWVAMATFPVACMRLWGSGSAGRVAACVLMLGWMAPFSIAPALVALLAVALFALRERMVITQTLVRIMVGAVILCATLIVVQAEMRAIKLGDILQQPLRNVVAQGLATNVLIAAVVLGIWRVGRPSPRVAGALALLLFVMAGLFWDQRAPWTRRMESYGVDAEIWPGVIEPNASIYWYRDLMAPWVLLGRSNYYAAQQGSGAVFSRDMVVELDRRRKLTGLLDFQEQVCRMMNGLNQKQTSCEPDVTAVEALCVEGHVDYVVLQNMLEGAAPIARYATGVVENGYEKRFYLYRCSVLKRG